MILVPDAEKTPDISYQDAVMYPDTIIQMAQNLKDERERRQKIEQKKEQLENHNQKLLPKAEYHDEVLASKQLMPVKIIAKELGTGPQKLNQFLHHHGVIYKQGRVWYLYYQHQGKGYARYDTFRKLNPDNYGTDVITYHNLKWTEKGRQMIHRLWNKVHNKLPIYFPAQT